MISDKYAGSDILPKSAILAEMIFAQSEAVELTFKRAEISVLVIGLCGSTNSSDKGGSLTFRPFAAIVKTLTP